MTRVLVVDDEPQIVRALVINLKARKYEVDAAHDGATALRLAAARHPDVVVLDLGLPDMDGVEVIRGLRGWTRVPMTTSPSRSAWTSCWPACGPPCAGPNRPEEVRTT
jgi:two-component system KDP operon response regulator KdpE